MAHWEAAHRAAPLSIPTSCCDGFVHAVAVVVAVVVAAVLRRSVRALPFPAARPAVARAQGGDAWTRVHLHHRLQRWRVRAFVSTTSMWLRGLGSGREF